eukprot:TRINITY_DN23308_c0_g1_i3.p1 TRINITY_DN23308_c0_g1~~TRINITY_DN23308_c0_g1_i3.p1  ORF type:complete len:253 (-),score=36.72 TRINITY_DN23308_c0_g1_i3:17-694(-)
MTGATWLRFHPVVILRVYDVGGSKEVSVANRILKKVGTGAFHAGVEVYGDEFSYGGSDYPGSGIFCVEPASCEAHLYREAIPMGETTLSPEQVQMLVNQMGNEWQGLDYDLLRHNCCFFSNDFCERLGVGPIPSWVRNLAGAGATLEDGFNAVESKAAAAKIVAAAKAGKIDEKYRVTERIQKHVGRVSGVAHSAAQKAAPHAFKAQSAVMGMAGRAGQLLQSRR